MPVPGGWMIVGSSVASYMSCAAVAAGSTVRPPTVHILRSTIASIAGAVVGAGRPSMRRWCKPCRRIHDRSTAPRSRCSDRPPEEKGGRKSGNWPLARRPDDQDPRHHRQPRPAVPLLADPWKHCRHHRGLPAGDAVAVQRLPDRRHGLRCPGTAPAIGVPWHGQRHSQQSDPQASLADRSGDL